MRDMLIREERDALNAVDREVESGQTKLRGLMKKFTENIDSMNKAKEDIHSLLSQSQALAFLQVRKLISNPHSCIPTQLHNNSKSRNNTHPLLLMTQVLGVWKLI